MGTWDDHDYGKNDAGVEWVIKEESQEIFLDFLGVSGDSPRREQEGVYHSFFTGPSGKRMQVILLDTRYFRSPLAEVPRKERVRGKGKYRPDDDPENTGTYMRHRSSYGRPALWSNMLDLYNMDEMALPAT